MTQPNSFAALANSITADFDAAYAEAEVKEGGWIPDDGNYTVLITGFSVTQDLKFNLTKDREGASVPAFGISVTCTMTADPSSPTGQPRSFRPSLLVLPVNIAAVTDPDRRKYLGIVLSKVKGMLKCFLDREPSSSLFADLLAAEKAVNDGLTPPSGVPIAVDMTIKTKNGYPSFFWNRRVA